MSDCTAVVLSGGRGSRLGNQEKHDLLVGDSTLLERVLAGTGPDIAVVVVGPPADTTRVVTFTLEEPRYGGPVAALGAALGSVSTPFVSLVAVDMPDSPALAAACVQRLRAQSDVGAVVPVDGTGRRQPLCAAYRTECLREAIAALGEVSGRSMRDLLAGLRVSEWLLDPGDWPLVADIDTPDELEGYRHRRSHD